MKWGQGSLTAILLSMLAGCASSPPPRQIPDPQIPPPAPLDFPRDSGEWNGSGGAASSHAPGEGIADFALQMRGSPYRYGGATRKGFDCSGLVFYAHRHFGMTVPRTSRDQARAAREVKQSKLSRGDLVFFKISSRAVNHVGIYIGERRFVHAPGAGKSVTVNSLDDDYYAERFASAGRFWDHAER